MSKWVDLFRADGQKAKIQVRDKDGIPVKISRGYLQNLLTRGWQGIDEIPEECIVDPDGVKLKDGREPKRT
jgi:hypothetical protein